MPGAIRRWLGNDVQSVFSFKSASLASAQSSGLVSSWFGEYLSIMGSAQSLVFGCESVLHDINRFSGDPKLLVHGVRHRHYSRVRPQAVAYVPRFQLSSRVDTGSWAVCMSVCDGHGTPKPKAEESGLLKISQELAIICSCVTNLSRLYNPHHAI